MLLFSPSFPVFASSLPQFMIRRPLLPPLLFLPLHPPSLCRYLVEREMKFHAFLFPLSLYFPSPLSVPSVVRPVQFPTSPHLSISLVTPSAPKDGKTKKKKKISPALNSVVPTSSLWKSQHTSLSLSLSTHYFFFSAFTHPPHPHPRRPASQSH